MNLKPIKDYENLYSFDLNSNQVYSHNIKKYKKTGINNNGYYQIILSKTNKRKTFDIHRLVYEMYNGEIPTGLFIDHIDGNKQNNNIDNLRLCNRSENACNRKIPKNNISTGYKNITLTKFNTYRVKISKNNKVIYNKTFKTLEEAITNRDIQLLLIHKEFHNLG